MAKSTCWITNLCVLCIYHYVLVYILCISIMRDYIHVNINWARLSFMHINFLCPQNSWIVACIFTTVALVWIFWTVHVQMWIHNTLIVACIITLVAFIWLFSAVHFQMNPQSTWIRSLVALCLLFPLCVFNSVLK